MRIWDQSDIYDLIKKYPQQFERGFRIAESIQLPKNIDQVVIASFSYNAAIAEIVKNLFEADATVPIQVCHGYDLPARITPQTLVVAVSLCGRRPEVLSAMQTACKATAKMVAVTTGGELEVFAREHKLPLILIDKNLPEMRPPADGKLSGGIIIAILIQILINSGVLNQKIRQYVLAAVVEIENMYLPKLGDKIAGLVGDTNLLIYSSEKYSGLAKLAKNLFNILIAMPCFESSLTEALGLDIYSFQRKGFAKYFALILQDKNETEPIQFSLQTLTDKLAEVKLKSYILDLPGSNQLTKTLTAVMLFYWVIYALLDKQK